MTDSNPAKQPPASNTTQHAGAEPTSQLGQPNAAANTRRAYASAQRQLAAWLNSRPLDDAGLAAYIGHLQTTGRAKATATMAVTAARRAARDTGQQPPDGPLTRQALDNFRGTDVDGARREQTRGLTADECAAILATCTRRRRSGRGLERKETAERRGLVDGAIVGLLFHGALRRSEVAALRWGDVDLSDGEDVVVTRRHSATRAAGEQPDVRRLVGGCAAAIRRLHAATTPEPADPVIGLSGDQINRGFAAACAAAGLEGRRTSHGGRVGLAVELTARGASTHAVQLAGGWKTPSMVVRYAATVATRDGGVSRYLR
ncbi:MAG: tyrosine-type recombinase/integrase [Acidobacteria bacterium]|nr:tyrosine-type recombinase/integrase [Acidobacteriota bacterium]